MVSERAADFSLEGKFAGFFRDVHGHRRMALHVAGAEVYLKVPKPLRNKLKHVLVAGQVITVTGRGAPGGNKAAVVAQVQVAGADACFSCPIRVCVKKNCWRNGGREVWRSLEERIAAAGLEDSLELKGVDCLDHCKKGPNVECAGRDYHHCTPADAERILAPFAE